MNETRTARGAKTLAGAYYTSVDVWQQEQERIFSRNWLYVGRASGSVTLVELCGESVIMAWDGEGIVRGFYNVCRHRGTRLCAEPPAQSLHAIQCPYHAWTYDLAGNLIGAPNMHEVAGFRKEDYPLHPVAVAEWAGCLFVNLDPAAPPLSQALAPIWGKFGAWQLAELVVAQEATYEVAANWKLIFQNYSECYHCPTLHPALNRLTPYRNAGNDLEEGPILGGPMRLSDGVGSMTLSGQRCAPPLGQVSGADLGCVYYYTLFPSMFLSLHPDYVLIHRLQPLAVDHTRVVCQWLFHPTALAQPGFDAGEAVAFWDMTNRQDWRVCELSQQGVSSRAYTPGPYAELESMIAAFDRAYLRALTAST